MARRIFLQKYALRNSKGELDPREIWSKDDKNKTLAKDFVSDIMEAMPNPKVKNPRGTANILSRFASRSEKVKVSDYLFCRFMSLSGK